jgi:hypothetical protein
MDNLVMIQSQISGLMSQRPQIAVRQRPGQILQAGRIVESALLIFMAAEC